MFDTYVGTYFTSGGSSMMEACLFFKIGFFLASVSERKSGYAELYPDRLGIAGRTPFCVRKRRPEMESVVWGKLASPLGLVVKARRLMRQQN